MEICGCFRMEPFSWTCVWHLKPIWSWYGKQICRFDAKSYVGKLTMVLEYDAVVHAVCPADM